MKIDNAKLRKNIDKTSGKHNFCRFFILSSYCCPTPHDEQKKGLFRRILPIHLRHDAQARR